MHILWQWASLGYLRWQYSLFGIDVFVGDNYFGGALLSKLFLMSCPYTVSSSSATDEQKACDDCHRSPVPSPKPKPD